MPHVLIVEDDADSAEMLSEVVSAEGFSTAIASTLRAARQQLAFRPPQLVLLDLSLPDGSGMDLFDALEEKDCEIVLITGHASLDTSIQALRLGVADYLIKPLNIDRLRAVLVRAGKAPSTRGQLNQHRELLESEGRFGRLWGRSAPMKEIYHQIARVAPTAVTAMIVGESGTGKELVAHTIHDLSKRADAPFLAVNCGAISPQLIESELFGHEKGSFTGAVRQHRGYFERSDGGTLFLDEVTEMPPELQVKLLRVLETGTFTPVGADKPMSTDVRIVAATNRNPMEAVTEGRLREDLYYRLAVFPIELPPLRDRREDIPLIANHFLAMLNEREGSSKRLTPQALELLMAYNWPGNVRELRNAVHRGFILSEGSKIDAAALPLEHVIPGGPTALLAKHPAATREQPSASPTGAAMADPTPPEGRDPEQAATIRAEPGASVAAAADAGHATAETTASQRSGAPEGLQVARDAGAGIEAPPLAVEHAAETAVAQAPGNAQRTKSLLSIEIGASIAEAERLLILATLEHCAGHRERAAEILGISAKTLYNRLKQYEKDGH